MDKCVRLDAVCNLIMGQSPDSESYNTEGRGYPFFQGNADFGELYPEVRIWCDAPTKLVDKGTLLISVRAPIGALNFANERCCIGRGLAGISTAGAVDLKYIFYNLLFLKDVLNSKGTGSTFKAVSKSILGEITIKELPLNRQQEVVTILDSLMQIINKYKKCITRLDMLVKSRFVEMFGMIAENPYGFPTATLKEVCYKITDGKHGGCEQEPDSGYYYVGAREIYDGYIHYDTAPQITYADFIKDYKRCNIERGDVVIVNTGATIGKTAIAISPLTERTLLQKSVALLKVKTEIVRADFLRHCYIANPSMYRVESASAQPNLLLSKINETQIYLPPLELQEQFAAFVQQVDKLKVVVQKGLDKAQMLFDSLMQQYFG